MRALEVFGAVLLLWGVIFVAAWGMQWLAARIDNDT